MEDFRRILYPQNGSRTFKDNRNKDLERGEEMRTLRTVQYYPSTPSRAYQPPVLFHPEGQRQAQSLSKFAVPPTRLLSPVPDPVEQVIQSEPRVSNSDSEFSNSEAPVNPISPERFRQAWEDLHSSPSTTTPNPNRVSMARFFLQMEDTEHGEGNIEKLDPGTSQNSSTRQSKALKQSLSSSRSRCPTPPLLFGKHSLTSTDLVGDDWETEEPTSQAQTTSSVANVSDPENQSFHQQRTIEQGKLTGYELGNSRYQHPTPLKSHLHPFALTPPDLKERRTHDLNRVSKSTELTDSFDQMVRMHGSSGEVGSSLAGISSPPAVDNSLPRTPEQSNVFSPPQSLGNIGCETRSKLSRRRSSSESDYILNSSLRIKTSALVSAGFRVHKKRNTMAGLTSSENPSLYEDSGSQDEQSQPILRERRTRHAQSDREGVSLFSTSTGLDKSTSQTQGSKPSTSTRSRPFVEDGIVYTDVPRPVLNHPVYGLHCPWDTPTPPRGRAQGRTEPFERPIARIESPHLHRIPRAPTAAMYKWQADLSRFWLVIFCIIPPIALIFGHGLADELIQMHTNGIIREFSQSTKTKALYWGYGVSISIIVGLIIIAVLGVFG